MRTQSEVSRKPPVRQRPHRPFTSRHWYSLASGETERMWEQGVGRG